MRHGSRADVAARLFLTIGALFPYWRLLTFGVIYVTDDYFTSDIFNGELPGRALIGQLIRQGEAPVWTSSLCSGLPLAGSAGGSDRAGGLYALPPRRRARPVRDRAAAGRRARCVRSGAALRRGQDRRGARGTRFRRLGLHRGPTETSQHRLHGRLAAGRAGVDRSRACARRCEASATGAARRFMAVFGLVFAQQVLAGFPQSAYICALVYGSFALFRHDRRSAAVGRWPRGSARLGRHRRRDRAGRGRRRRRAAAVVGAGERFGSRGGPWLGVVHAARVLAVERADVPGAVHQRRHLQQHLHRAAVLLGGLRLRRRRWRSCWRSTAAIRERRRPVVVFSIVMTVVAYLCVLGAATPFFGGLRARPRDEDVPLPDAVPDRRGARSRAARGRRPDPPASGSDAEMAASRRALPLLIAVAICAGTALDLYVHQPRQNPMVPAAQWLAAPSDG